MAMRTRLALWVARKVWKGFALWLSICFLFAQDIAQSLNTFVPPPLVDWVVVGVADQIDHKTAGSKSALMKVEATFLGLKMLHKAYQGEASTAKGKVNDCVEAWDFVDIIAADWQEKDADQEGGKGLQMA
ncbi:hypothetical protein SLEP1_g23647 [Rubroshorea leprosula]|uniref:Uncharacterized protein n=1 Tax=Rubroshorea leprosula TaxID=152421 RepID=A0AAV5JIA7_9ROSI|nr:hypothetical protein SLEP1_g23647 [Rubroshorea leprosula]